MTTRTESAGNLKTDKVRFLSHLPRYLEAAIESIAAATGIAAREERCASSMPSIEFDPRKSGSPHE
jgi:hypothetical protein